VTTSLVNKWGFSGVMQRSSGQDVDLRRDYPYDVYAKLFFKVPLGTNGDCYDRYLLRMEEMRIATAIVNSCIEAMPFGSIKVDDDKITPPARDVLRTSPVARRRHFTYYSRGTSIEAGYSYTSVEAPKGEFGLFFVADGSTRPARCKIKAPGFLHLQGLNAMSRGHFIADVVTTIGTQDIVFGEVDR
jgi:NADH:ubiquinone oxidoreductase subunit D